MNTATVRRGGPSAGGLAYTVDGQGVVLRVQEASRRVDRAAAGRQGAAVAAGPRVAANLGALTTPARLGRAGGDDRSRTARYLPDGHASPGDTDIAWARERS